MVDEQTHVWYILSDRYGDLAWEMLEDMVGEEFCYKKASKYLTFIMDNWPKEEVCRTLLTWIEKSELIVNKLDEDVIDRFMTEYRDYIHSLEYKKQNTSSWPKPTKI